MSKSDYTIIRHDGFIIIEDLNLGRMSVTNDIENVVKRLARNYSLDYTRVIYRDSDGHYFEINIAGDKFDSFGHELDYTLVRERNGS